MQMKRRKVVFPLLTMGESAFMLTRKAFLSFFLGGLCWLILLGVSFAVLGHYESSAGKTVSLASAWPVQSRLHLDSKKPTLLMFIHPQCPCSRASLFELFQMLDALKYPVDPYLVFYKPSDFPENWDKTDVWDLAGHIPGAIRVEDPDGVETNRFNSETSGQTMLFSPQGRLLFSGGLTNGRGVTGISTGRLTLSHILEGQTALNNPSFKVFGCPLFSISNVKG
jgi:hypothetical protein